MTLILKGEDGFWSDEFRWTLPRELVNSVSQGIDRSFVIWCKSNLTGDWRFSYDDDNWYLNLMSEDDWLLIKMKFL